MRDFNWDHDQTALERAARSFLDVEAEESDDEYYMGSDDEEVCDDDFGGFIDDTVYEETYDVNRDAKLKRKRKRKEEKARKEKTALVKDTSRTPGGKRSAMVVDLSDEYSSDDEFEQASSAAARRRTNAAISRMPPTRPPFQPDVAQGSQGICGLKAATEADCLVRNPRAEPMAMTTTEPALSDRERVKLASRAAKIKSTAMSTTVDTAKPNPSMRPQGEFGREWSTLLAQLRTALRSSVPNLYRARKALIQLSEYIPTPAELRSAIQLILVVKQLKSKSPNGTIREFCRVLYRRWKRIASTRAPVANTATVSQVQRKPESSQARTASFSSRPRLLTRSIPGNIPVRRRSLRLEDAAATKVRGSPDATSQAAARVAKAPTRPNGIFGMKIPKADSKWIKTVPSCRRRIVQALSKGSSSDLKDAVKDLQTLASLDPSLKELEVAAETGLITAIKTYREHSNREERRRRTKLRTKTGSSSKV